MQPAHRRQDRGNSIGALHPEKVLSKAFRTRVRFPPPPPKRKGRTSVRPFLFASMGCWSGPASARQQWIWRRRASSAGLDSRLYFRAVKVRSCFYQKTCRKRSRVFYRRKQLFHVYISSAPLDGETRSVVKYTYTRPDHHRLCL